MRSAVLITHRGSTVDVRHFADVRAARVEYKAGLGQPLPEGTDRVELWTSDGGRIKHRKAKPVRPQPAPEPSVEAEPVADESAAEILNPESEPSVEAEAKTKRGRGRPRKTESN